MSLSTEAPRLTVALLQRSIPHYRLSLFEKLNRESRFRWEFFFDHHANSDASGLSLDSYGDLHIHRVSNRALIGGLTYQANFKIRRDHYAAILLDLGWTLLSNPKHLIEAKLKGIRRIGWSKGVAQAPGRQKSRFRLAYERFIIGQCDALVAYGQISKDYFRALGYPPERIFVAQNTIDTERVIRERPLAISEGEKLKTRLSLSSRPVVGYLGKIAPFKKVDRIIAAFERVRSSGVDAVLLLAGSGSAVPSIEAQIASSPFASDIRFMGEVPPGAEAGYLQALDLYVSFAQGGLGILEAMANGRAVLSTPERYPETELLSDNETAFLSVDFSVESFAYRMADAITDPIARADVGHRAEQRVSREASQEQMVRAIDAAVVYALAH